VLKDLIAKELRSTLQELSQDIRVAVNTLKSFP